MKKSNSPTWIWYPGDYEIWLGNEMQNRRTERGGFFPPFWKMDSHYVAVEFSTKLDLPTAEEVEIYVEGRYNIKLDGKILPAYSKMTIPAGKHSLNIKVHNQANVPSIYVKGKTFGSDETWKVTFEDKEWIDESGKASDTSSGTVYLDAGAWNFDSPDTPPSKFKLSTTPMQAVKTEQKNNGVLVDFGKETFGFVKFHNLKGKGKLSIFYGESSEEALDTEYCETLDYFDIDNSTAEDFTLPDSKAYRYIYIEKDSGLSYDEVSMLYEYLPLDYRGSFRCSDELINKIWDISAYTMHLTSREFFIDGIKRDRWIWSGDAYQSYLMNYYLFFDSPSVTRTMLNLRGKDPVTSHTNTIMDYTFYWFMGIYDYLQYTGDTKFVEQFYPRMQSLIDYCLSRRNTDGMMEGLAGDWVFIDWADFEMSKNGEVSFEQLLFCRSLETMALCAGIMNDTENKEKYSALASDLKGKLFTTFWSKDKGAFIHNRENGVKSEQVTPYTNMFAVLFNYLDTEKTDAVKNNVLLNPDALKITTPYMRFYELEALCALGEHNHVLKEIRDYWGGMLDLGATSFWEKYNPNEKDTEHLAMYGRPYGKSLCHAWGASPIYLLGKYYIGVKPEKQGYAEFSIRPVLGDLKWMESTVPTPNGDIKVYMDAEQIKVLATEGEGYLYFDSKSEPQTNMGQIEKLEENKYKLRITSNAGEYVVKMKL
ncbi:alpha-L-rhamnosidase C-terminal domain-containing protein [Dysgonomonas sp. 520]|uniref:alpha-L-rhamnosidase-related protein n=1 Tax=Dysgonomonas sp. 520 TaxID=2302931 RepID=UPI0013D15E95|nr:alpha-L-rhamnosidase C-terminal domain-containing protein [Dysgonomonas sp. 520]NDW09708.1 alpha-rhamnosidase [Dysgonomonas sp. 520]